MKIVILQPQYFPWAGVFEQIRLSDIYVHYDDVQFPQGRSFTSRVQVKTPVGQTWMTVPVLKNTGAMISETMIDYSQRWQDKHLGLLKQSYIKAPFFKEMISIAEAVIRSGAETISVLNIIALETISSYFGMKTVFKRSSSLGIGGESSERLVEICKHFQATSYITGMGAKKYVDYDLFEKNNIKLEYMDYLKMPYPQFFGDFIPYVSILDLIAQKGKNGLSCLISPSLYWRDMPNVDPGQLSHKYGGMKDFCISCGMSELDGRKISHDREIGQRSGDTSWSMG